MNIVYIFVAAMALIGSVMAANSWADEQDLGSPRYDPIPPMFRPAIPPIFNFNMNTPPIFGTKYFGNAPNYLFKPLPHVFRPPVQKRPPPMKDATIMCAAILCSAPATCRLVQSCPTCAPKAACIAPTAVPRNFDQSCQMHGYKQAVMLHHVSPAAGIAAAMINPSATTSLRCIPWLPSLTRGGCSQGSACVSYTQPGAPPGTGTCCAGPIANPVPMMPQVAPPPASMVPQAATPPAPMVPQVAPPPAVPVNSAAAAPPMMHRGNKPGTCPVNSMASTCSGVPCTMDSACGSYLKCCPNSCGGSTCVVPSLPAPLPLQLSAHAQTTYMQG